MIKKTQRCRAPAPGTNHEERVAREETREKTARQGGDPDAVTRKPRVRKGSRKRAKGARPSKQELLAIVRDKESEAQMQGRIDREDSSPASSHATTSESGYNSQPLPQKGLEVKLADVFHIEDYREKHHKAVEPDQVPASVPKAAIAAEPEEEVVEDGHDPFYWSRSENLEKEAKRALELEKAKGPPSPEVITALRAFISKTAEALEETKALYALARGIKPRVRMAKAEQTAIDKQPDPDCTQDIASPPMRREIPHRKKTSIGVSHSIQLVESKEKTNRKVKKRKIRETQKVVELAAKKMKEKKKEESGQKGPKTSKTMKNRRCSRSKKQYR